MAMAANVGSSTSYTQGDIGLAFSKSSVDDFPTPNDLATLNTYNKKNNRSCKKKHDQEYTDLLNSRRQTRQRWHTHAAHKLMQEFCNVSIDVLVSESVWISTNVCVYI